MTDLQPTLIPSRDCRMVSMHAELGKRFYEHRDVLIFFLLRFPQLKELLLIFKFHQTKQKQKPVVLLVLSFVARGR